MVTHIGVGLVCKGSNTPPCQGAGPSALQFLGCLSYAHIPRRRTINFEAGRVLGVSHAPISCGVGTMLRSFILSYSKFIAESTGERLLNSVSIWQQSYQQE